ncbi:MAG: tRNA (N6-isopentenyl adenosine(37)-C2)-methylthiotransferase MiaB [Bdellovibrionaceae bacterium]|nr:tRNA (N6-isopentenyl adenosine(37)-C2)-methylthiotransferase MiaB [Pseudobdellovibrionaceae bacterium]
MTSRAMQENFTDNNNESKENLGVYISTYGCQMNVNDTDRMYSLLEMVNFNPVSRPEDADLIIINSCSVREKPVHKVHSEVGRYKNLKKSNSKLRIGVGGCVGQQEKKNLLSDVPLLDFVFGTDAIDELPDIVEKIYRNDQKIVRARFEHQKPYQIQTLNRNPGISTFVNITKGCDNFCTFCVVPFTRGRERSRSLNELVKDVNSLVQRGVKEVTLLGQNVNSYKSECGAHFSKLLEVLAQDTDIERIRYTTSHPKDFDQELCDVMARNREKICEYIHLPVQSGNSEVLARMNRGYSRKEYLDKVLMIKNFVPGVSLSTDIIVGFPGETEEQFEDTLSLLEEVEYETLFAFKYSPRPFTKAAKFEDQLSEQQKSERLNQLFAKHDEIAFPLAKKYEGQILKVLVEKHNLETGKVNGRSTQNKLVHFSGGSDLIGKTVSVEITEAFPQTLRGKRVEL